jgi:predicted ATPase
MGKASFLNKDRFKKENKRYANDYIGQLTWEDGKSDNPMSLNAIPDTTTIENAQYLPQRYIEEVCNDLGNGFKDEINQVIFSYVDITERGKSNNLEQLINQKTVAFQELIEQKTSELREINSIIIGLENKLTKSYVVTVDSGLKKYNEKLERHEKSRPQEVSKPKQDNDPEYVKKLTTIEEKIKELEKQICEKGSRLTDLNMALDELNATIIRIENVKSLVEKLDDELLVLSQKYSITNLTIEANFTSSISTIKTSIDKFNSEKDSLLYELDASEDADKVKSLSMQLKLARKEKEEIISSANEQEKVFQKYVDDLSAWEEQRQKIIGSFNDPDSLNYFNNEKEYIESFISAEYEEKILLRYSIMEEIFRIKEKIASVYSAIYVPVEEQINHLIGDMDDKIIFVTELSLCNTSIGEELINMVNKTYVGIFNGTDQASATMKELIASTDFNNWESVRKFAQSVLQTTSEDWDVAAKKVKDREAFYEKLCSLKYLDAQYNLTVDNKHLEALSPGEKGVVLLVFYLALSKDERPLIIDQPEDNLDNQSVFCKLVKCIKEAKKKRQVIIVTHNPNIAVACDSEQIIYCSMNKGTYHITYRSGSIENPEIKEHVIDVLEGTMPAFDLRRKKYRIGQ